MLKAVSSEFLYRYLSAQVSDVCICLCLYPSTKGCIPHYIAMLMTMLAKSLTSQVQHVIESMVEPVLKLMKLCCAKVKAKESSEKTKYSNSDLIDWDWDLHKDYRYVNDESIKREDKVLVDGSLRFKKLNFIHHHIELSNQNMQKNRKVKM